MSYQISAVRGGKSQTLALLQHGELLGWGGAGSGRYSPENVDICSTRTTEREPVYVGQSVKFLTVSAGYGVSLGISTKSEALVWGWNPIVVGGDQASSELPTPIESIRAPIAVAAGQSIFAALDQAGELYTWGLNVDHALGRTTRQLNASPGLLGDLPAMQAVDLGDNFMIALSRLGEVFSFGSNSAGQLGLGHLRHSATPARVRLAASITGIAVGATHVLAVCSQGKVYGWGSNQYGQLGHQHKRYESQPTAIEMPERISALAAGTHFSFALAESGRVYGWGWNGVGQLGLNDMQSRSTPTLIPSLTGIRAIAAGEMHVLAVGKQALYGWGSNDAGQIGRAAPRQLTPYPLWENG